MDADVSEIAAVRQALEAAENAFDAGAAAEMLADDAVLMVPDFPVQEGVVACASFLRDIMGWLAGEFERHITYVSEEVAVAGDIAFDRGTYSFTVSPKTGGSSDQVTGKYLWILKRTNGEPWKVARLIVNRDQESGAGEAPAPPLRPQPSCDS